MTVLSKNDNKKKNFDNFLKHLSGFFNLDHDIIMVLQF